MAPGGRGGLWPLTWPYDDEGLAIHKLGAAGQLRRAVLNTRGRVLSVGTRKIEGLGEDLMDEHDRKDRDVRPDQAVGRICVEVEGERPVRGIGTDVGNG